MTLAQASAGKEYTITRLQTGDEALEAFLFTLGCYSGEPIRLIFRRRNNLTVAIKNSRYSIDSRLASAICVA